jgi:methyl-accepting chemotaxis protein
MGVANLQIDRKEVVMNTIQENDKRSLSYLVAFWSALAIAISMGIYAIFQYFTSPGKTIGGLFLEHLWHVLVLGVVIYGLLWIVLRRSLLRPIQKIYLHLYKVGTGRVEPLVLQTRIRELETIVEGVNVMIERMGQSFPADEIADAREAAKKAYEKAPQEAQAILDNLARLQESIVQSANNRGVARKNGRVAA